MKEKIKSRKFIVWLTSTIFVAISLILNFVADNMGDITKIFAESWGWISSIYIGTNVAQKFASKNSNSEFNEIIER